MKNRNKCQITKEGVCPKTIKDTCPKNKCLGMSEEEKQNKLKSIAYRYEE